MRKFIINILVILAISLTSIVLAQEPKTTTITYSVDHKHAVGIGKGELRITKAGIEYRGESKNESLHGRNWQD